MTCARVREFNSKPPPELTIEPKIPETSTPNTKAKLQETTTDNLPKKYNRTLLTVKKAGMERKQIQLIHNFVLTLYCVLYMLHQPLKIKSSNIYFFVGILFSYSWQNDILTMTDMHGVVIFVAIHNHNALCPPAENTSQGTKSNETEARKQIEIQSACQWDKDSKMVLEALCQRMNQNRLSQRFWVGPYHIRPVAKIFMRKPSGAMVTYRVGLWRVMHPCGSNK